jgi:sulfur dioxygenase
LQYARRRALPLTEALVILRQLFDHDSSTFTYLIADDATGEAALIDPVLEKVDRDLGLIADLGLILRYAMDTHVHADHVTAAGEIRRRTGCRTVAGARGASCADLHMDDGETLMLGELTIEVLATPGHTDDSVCYRIGNEVFTGDTLFVRGNGRTDFQNGDPAALYDSITRKLFTLPDGTRVWPAHDYKGFSETTIGEEKRLNPRLAGKTRAEFIAVMNSLDLPPPKKLQTAVAANRACGADPATMHAVPDPQPARPARATSIDEIDVTSLATLPGARIIDVREAVEYNGDLGHLPGAEHVPLAVLPSAAAAWDRSTDIVLVCRSGKRSLDGARRLLELGFSRVHSLRGGMLAVRQRA